MDAIVAKHHGFDISAEDLARVQGTHRAGWLNSNSIDYACKVAALGTNYTAFAPEFWKTLNEKGPSAVKRWYHKLGNLRKMRNILVPINEHGSHWTLIIIRMTARKITYYNSLTYSQAAATAKMNRLLDYIEDQSIGVPGKKEPFDFQRDKWVPATAFEYETQPQQDNFCDCGLMVYIRALRAARGIHVAPGIASRAHLYQTMLTGQFPEQ